MYCSVALPHLRKHIVLAALLFSALSPTLLGNAAAQDAARATREHMAASQEGAAILQPDEMPGIVRIACPSSGTVGTAFKHRSGYLLAADSSVSSCKEVVVSLQSGQRVEAEVVARDRPADLAMLFPKQPIPGRALEFATQPDLPIGAPTATVGFPAGYIGNAALFGIGYVSGYFRQRVDANRQVTKLIVGGNYNSGLAGSPLFDRSGGVVGILSGLLPPWSEGTLSALKSLRDERGSAFFMEKPDGAKVPLSEGQVVAMILQEMMTLTHYVVALATPMQELRAFMAKNGVDL